MSGRFDSCHPDDGATGDGARPHTTRICDCLRSGLTVFALAGVLVACADEESATRSPDTGPAADALGAKFEGAEQLADTPTDVGDPYLLLRSAPEEGAGTSTSSAPIDEAHAESSDLVDDPDGRYEGVVSWLDG